jgi:tripartite-type tricarboxylate transporter receptor subunit TctC
MVQVSYRDFNQAIVDLGEGGIDAVASGVAPLHPHAETGKLRLLAFINRQRAPFAPEVPTVAEAGYPDLTFDAITGFFGWRDMPAELRERIAADVRSASTSAAPATFSMRSSRLGCSNATRTVATPTRLKAISISITASRPTLAQSWTTSTPNCTPAGIR